MFLGGRHVPLFPDFCLSFLSFLYPALLCPQTTSSAPLRPSPNAVPSPMSPISFSDPASWCTWMGRCPREEVQLWGPQGLLLPSPCVQSRATLHILSCSVQGALCPVRILRTVSPGGGSNQKFNCLGAGAAALEVQPLGHPHPIPELWLDSWLYSSNPVP